MQTPVVGCAMFRVVQILNAVKKELKVLDGDFYKKMDEHVLIAKSHLEAAQKELHNKPFDTNLQFYAEASLDTYMDLSAKQLSLLK